MLISLRGHRDRIQQSDKAEPPTPTTEDAALPTRRVSNMLFIWEKIYAFYLMLHALHLGLFRLRVKGLARGI